MIIKKLTSQNDARTSKAVVDKPITGDNMIFLNKPQRDEDTDGHTQAYPRNTKRKTAKGCAMTEVEAPELVASRKTNRTPREICPGDVHDRHRNGAWRNVCNGLRYFMHRIRAIRGLVESKRGKEEEDRRKEDKDERKRRTEGE